MSNKSIYGILGVIVVLGLLLLATQHFLGSGTGSNNGSSGSAQTGSGGGDQKGGGDLGPPSSITEAKLRQHWKQLIASAPPPRGSANAPYQVIEIGDFQCPVCGRLKPVLETIVQASGNKAKLYFVNWPLTKIHAHAMDAAEAGDAAAAQGKFWQMYDMLYGDQSDLQPALIEASARTIPGLNFDQLSADMNGHKYVPAINAQAALAEQVGAVATPTFLVRLPSGRFDWYVGRNGSKREKGIGVLAEHPPWGGGMSDQQFASMTADPGVS